MPLEYCHCIVMLYCSLSHCQKFIIATFYSFSVGYFIVLSSDCFTMMSYWYCVSIVYACHLKLAFVHLLYLYLLCEHSITPCGLNKVYLILSYNPTFNNQVSTNIGKEFFKLLRKYFPKENKFYKLFNRNNIKTAMCAQENAANHQGT